MKNTFKIILATLSLIFSFDLYAQDSIQAPVGAYKFKSHTELLTVKKTELVPMASQAGKQRVLELQKAGWTCQVQANYTSKCTIFAKNETLPDRIGTKIYQEFKDTLFLFSPTSSISLINEGDSLKEYEVSQEVFWNHLSISSYLIQVATGGPIKMQMAFKTDKVYLNIVDEKTVAAYETYYVEKNRQSTMYFVQISFEKD